MKCLSNRIDDRDRFFIVLCFDLLEFSLLSQLFSGAVLLDGMCKRNDVVSWNSSFPTMQVALQKAR